MGSRLSQRGIPVITDSALLRVNRTLRLHCAAAGLSHGSAGAGTKRRGGASRYAATATSSCTSSGASRYAATATVTSSCPSSACTPRPYAKASFSTVGTESIVATESTRSRHAECGAGMCRAARAYVTAHLRTAKTRAGHRGATGGYRAALIQLAIRFGALQQTARWTGAGRCNRNVQRTVSRLRSGRLQRECCAGAFELQRVLRRRRHGRHLQFGEHPRLPIDRDGQDWRYLWRTNAAPTWRTNQRWVGQYTSGTHGTLAGVGLDLVTADGGASSDDDKNFQAPHCSIQLTTRRCATYNTPDCKMQRTALQR